MPMLVTDPYFNCDSYLASGGKLTELIIPAKEKRSAVGWSAACAGGRVRDGAVPSHALWDWRRPGRRP